MPIIVSEFCPNKTSILSITLVILYIIICILDENLQFYQKIFHIAFHLYSNCNSIPIIVSDCFPPKILNFINYPMISYFYHMCYMKISVWPENVSTSSCNYILNVYVCLSLYLSFFPKNIFNFFSYHTQFSILWYIC